MRTLRSLVLGLGAVLLLVAAPTAFVGASESNPQTEGLDAKALQGLTTDQIADCRRQSAANGAGQDIFLSTPTPKTYVGLAWQNVECTPTSFRLASGQRALVVANFNAEADCNGTTPTNGQWCQTRAVLSGPNLALTEGAPIAAEPSSFAFDSVAGGRSNWQAHSMARAWDIRCASANGCQYKFAVQTKMHNSTVTSMWLDEIATDLRITYGNPAPL